MGFSNFEAAERAKYQFIDAGHLILGEPRRRKVGRHLTPDHKWVSDYIWVVRYQIRDWDHG
jgi:hypothetical protein